MDVKYIRKEIEKNYSECCTRWEETNNLDIIALRLQFSTFWNWVDSFIECQDTNQKDGEVKGC